MTGDDSPQGMGGSASRRDVLRSAAAVGAFSVVGTVPTVSAQGDLVEKTYGGSWGGRTYLVYEPSGYDGSADVPVMVMLHGCTQDASTFASETRMNDVAENENFLVVYPETSAHMNDCWHWWDDGHRRRGNGEADDIAGIVDEVKGDYSVDDQQVYVSGFSAGGGMTGDLVAEYADVFAGAGTVAGFPYGAADDENDATMVMSMGSGNPQQLGDEAYESMEGHGITSMLPTIVIHGTDDTTVDDVNGEEATEQAVQTNDQAHNGQDDGSVDLTPDNTETGTTGGYSWERNEYEDADGNVVVVELFIDGLGHDWPGGEPGGQYTAPDAPNANELIWEYLSQHERDSLGDGEGPGDDPDDDPGGDDPDDDDGDDDGTGDDSEDEGGDDDEFYCGTATNADHVDAGRAYESWGCYYAEGSNDYLGCMGVEENTLEETSEGYFQTTSACNGGGDDGEDDDGSWWSW